MIFKYENNRCLAKRVSDAGSVIGDFTETLGGINNGNYTIT